MRVGILLMFFLLMLLPTVVGQDAGARPAAPKETPAAPTPLERRAEETVPRPVHPGLVVEEPRSIDDFSKPISEWQHATGDWWGLRLWLDKHGITPEIFYTGDLFSNWRGGLSTHDATKYLSQLDMTLTFDTERLGLWKGGTFYVYGDQHTGHGITERYVGDFQVLDHMDADPHTRVSEYWYLQSLFDDRLKIKLGKQDANADFGVADFAVDFINSSFITIPTVPITTWPDTGLGVAGFVEPTDWLWIGSGIYDGDPHGGQWGFHSTFDGEGGTFSVVETALKPRFGRGGRCPGRYGVGFWYHSDDHFEKWIPEAEEGEEEPVPRVFAHNYGLYGMIDQVLFRERGEEGDEQGLAAFFQIGWAPDDRNEVSKYYGGGLIYVGLIPGRDEDLLGVGVAHAQFSTHIKDFEGRTHETAIEWFYKLQVTPYLFLQPDMQFIVNPDGHGRNALVGGMRCEILF